MNNNGDNSKKSDTKKKIIKKPNPFIYYPVIFLARIFLTFKLHVTYELKALQNIKEPSIVLCPHVSNIDFLLVASALLPHRPTFIVSQHFMANPKVRWILQIANVITKKMFCPDIKTILSVMRAKESGNIIVIFPEGRLSCFGHSLQVADGTAELIKKLDIDVYTISEDGAYKTFPKWGKSGFRPGRINVRGDKLLEALRIKNMSVEEINEILDSAILHDEDLLFTDITYKCKSPALGLDRILYKCPECLCEFQTVSDDFFITCTSCGLKVELDQKYRLHGGPFQCINDWYFWQEEMIDLDMPLETECLLGAVNDKGNMDKTAGSGFITMDREKIHFLGNCYGKPLEFTESTSIVKGFPASVGDHFDIYSKKILYYILPQPDKRVSIKWVIYLDKLTKEKSKQD